MKVVIIEPEKAYKADIDEGLESMQKVVGGHIEIISAEWLPNGSSIQGQGMLAVLNEEGKLNGMPFNSLLSTGDYLVGTFFVCKGTDDGDLIGLSENEAEAVLSLFTERM